MKSPNIATNNQNFKDNYLKEDVQNKLLSNRFLVQPIDKSGSKKIESSYDKAVRIAKIATAGIAGTVLCITAYNTLFGVRQESTTNPVFFGPENNPNPGQYFDPKPSPRTVLPDDEPPDRTISNPNNQDSSNPPYFYIGAMKKLETYLTNEQLGGSSIQMPTHKAVNGTTLNEADHKSNNATLHKKKSNKTDLNATNFNLFANETPYNRTWIENGWAQLQSLTTYSTVNWIIIGVGVIWLVSKLKSLLQNSPTNQNRFGNLFEPEHDSKNEVNFAPLFSLIQSQLKDLNLSEHVTLFKTECDKLQTKTKIEREDRKLIPEWFGQLKSALTDKLNTLVDTLRVFDCLNIDSRIPEEIREITESIDNLELQYSSVCHILDRPDGASEPAQGLALSNNELGEVLDMWGCIFDPV